MKKILDTSPEAGTCFGSDNNNYKSTKWLNSTSLLFGVSFQASLCRCVQPLTDKSQWPNVDLDFKLLPPMTKRPVGRQRKNRILG